MDTELKCNRLTCRRSLTDKAVVTTCSHIFCVECANELFNSARLCPACESSLSEPDDVVVCSLHPSNDYKTSVLSGLTPSIILEICSRAISFWQYQIHQENSFQHAVLRNLNDKNAQLQKQLDNVIREANSEISLLTTKASDLEQDLEIERRKVRDLQEATREREKEYRKLKAQHDKIKRKALLAPNLAVNDVSLNGTSNSVDESRSGQRAFGTNIGNGVGIGAVVGSMEANGIQRTPIVVRTSGGFPPAPPSRLGNNTTWLRHTAAGAAGMGTAPEQLHRARPQEMHRQPPQMPADRSYHSGNVSDRSDSTGEVENILMGGNYQRGRVPTATGGWPSGGGTSSTQRIRSTQRAFAPANPAKRPSGTFRPAFGR